MSGYRLCRVDMAEKPYYIENIGINIFSLEELCYYIVNDTALLDETIMNKTLTEWLSTELKLVQLSQTLDKLLSEGCSMADFAVPILREDGYLSYNELQNFRALLVKLGEESREIRLKKKADALVKCDKLSGAIAVYRKVLELPGLHVKDSFIAVLYHNMGVAYIRLLQYREALECFEKALKLAYTRPYLKAYLLAFALCKPKEKYEAKLEELGVDEKTKKEVEEELRESYGGQSETPRNMDHYLDGLTRSYHKAADL
jgi:tetratricopeptide (TPR) repeat protein